MGMTVGGGRGRVGITAKRDVKMKDRGKRRVTKEN